MIEPGYNLMRRSAPPEWQVERVPLDTPIPLELTTTDLFVQNLICELRIVEHPNRTDEDDPPDRPAPPEADIDCDADGRGYSWDLYQCQECSCFSDRGSLRLADNDPVPADWPCEVP
jgi:hypothetical protein